MKKTNKTNKNAKVNVAPVAPVNPLADDNNKQTPVVEGQEATKESMIADLQRANGILPLADVPNPEKPPVIVDELMLSPDSTAWNANDKNVCKADEQTIANNVLTRFEYVATPLLLPNGKPSKFQSLTCSDNGLEVGRPFNPKTYTLLNNAAFLGVIADILAVIEKLGHKARIASSGTLMERDRQFISIQLLDVDDLKVDDKRIIKSFINCLNSIPSNAGVTVTFANNSFVVCCRNTFAHVLRKADDTQFHAALKHSKGLKPMLQDIPLMVESYLSGNEKLLKQLKSFIAIPVSLIEAEQIFAAFIVKGKSRLPKTNKQINDLSDDKFLTLAGFASDGLTTRSANIVTRLKELFTRGDGNKGESSLDLFQAVTQYYTHESAGDSDNAMKQIQSSEAGSGLIAKADFYDLLVAITQCKSKWQGVAKVGDTVLVSYVKAKEAKAKA